MAERRGGQFLTLLALALFQEEEEEEGWCTLLSCLVLCHQPDQ